VSARGQTIEGAEAAAPALRDYDAVRASSDIQFAPLQPKAVPPAETPGWLKALGEFFKAIFEPIGEAFGMSWPVLQWVLLGVAVLGVLFLAWRIIEPLLDRPARAAAAIEPQWNPDSAEALALLEDADRLAAEGKFDEATHLLLRRSVKQIAEVRPDWVHPASTARELALLGGLPEAARRAFGVIAARVEASRYALRRLAAEDWAAARGAYAEFALGELTR
jgi:hypothetical protein